MIEYLHPSRSSMTCCPHGHKMALEGKRGGGGGMVSIEEVPNGTLLPLLCGSACNDNTARVRNDMRRHKSFFLNTEYTDFTDLPSGTP